MATSKKASAKRKLIAHGDKGDQKGGSSTELLTDRAQGLESRQRNRYLGSPWPEPAADGSSRSPRPRRRHSGIVSPLPPTSFGMSLNFGSPSRIGSTVSA